MRVLKAISYVLLTSFTTAVFAAPNWHTSTLHAVYPMADGSFILLFNTNAAACTNPNAPYKYHYVKVDQNGMTEAGAQKIYAAALMALAAGKTVTINFDDASDGCYVNRLIALE